MVCILITWYRFCEITYLPYDLPCKYVIRIWLDYLCVPQENRKFQKLAIGSLCVYASLASRFVPLVRNAEEWNRLHADKAVILAAVNPMNKIKSINGTDPQSEDDEDEDEDDLLVQERIPGTLQRYIIRSWCRLELLAGLCPKRAGPARQFREGPVNLRFRFYQDPEHAGCGPLINESKFILNPVLGQLSHESDRVLV